MRSGQTYQESSKQGFKTLDSSTGVQPSCDTCLICAMVIIGWSSTSNHCCHCRARQILSCFSDTVLRPYDCHYQSNCDSDGDFGESLESD